MKVYCILGLDYVYGNSLSCIPKIYGVYKNKDEALKERQKLLVSVSNLLSINEIELN